MYPYVDFSSSLTFVTCIQRLAALAVVCRLATILSLMMMSGVMRPVRSRSARRHARPYEFQFRVRVKDDGSDLSITRLAGKPAAKRL